MPVILGPMLTRCHCYTFAIWVLIRIATSLDNHCGYSFALTPVRLLPFGTTAPGHDHHHSDNDGMLASQFTLLDVLYRSLGSFPEAKKRSLLARSAADKGGPEATEEAEESRDPLAGAAAAAAGGAGSRRRATSRSAPAARASRG
jgi:sterol desaturase/sphingolipid hydroxylase (fatty acid hydroxylase superfamily)